MSSPTPSERLYRVMVRAYPRSFRRRYGAGLLEVFRDQRAEPEYAGAWGAVRFWRRMTWDWIKTIVTSRRVARTSRRAEAGWAGLAPGGSPNGEVVVDAMKQDLAFAVRSLRRAPLFTLIAVVTLAIGIGSNAAIFGVVRSVLIEPLPYGQPDRVVTIWSSWDGFPKTWVSEAEYRAYLTRTGATFDDVAMWYETNVSFTDPERPERVLAVGATENLTSVLGVEMRHGRFFSRAEAMRTDSMPADVVVVSHEAWMRRWNGDPAVVGVTTEMNGRVREVIGVLPEGFRLPTQFAAEEPADLYFPAYVSRDPITDYPEYGGSHGSYVVGRLAPGVSVEVARSAVESAIAGVDADFAAYPSDRRFTPLLYAASEDVFGTLRPALLALLATVAFVLLIACANVANLMLARSDDRADELAVRAALGAGRRRLVGQLLVESLVLATLGGLAGTLLAVGAVDALKMLNPGNLPRIDEVALDGGVLLFTTVVTLGTAVLFGVLPALRTTGAGLRARLGRRSERTGRAKWQGVLVAVEVALAVVLVVGAGLMVRTFSALTAIEPGFDGRSTLTVAVSLPTTRYPDAEAAVGFHRELLRRVEELPGVRSVGAVRTLPLASQIGDWGLDIEGYDESVNPPASGDWQIAAPGYFETLGIPLVDGRTFDWSDDSDAAPVGIVNETFVERFWPDQEPLGRTFVMSGTTVTVVGVVGDVRHNAIDAPIKEKFYIPVAQWAAVTRGIPTSLRLVARTAGDPTALIGSVRAAVRDLDPTLAVAEVRTIEDVLRSSVAQPRFMVVLMGAFSAIALVLAMVGVYGVIAYGVGKRTQEIGVRMAFGAMQEQVVSLMVRKGAAMVGVGLVAGVVLAVLLGRYVDSLLYEVSPTDPLTFLSVAVGFAAVSALATWIPSRRAASIDPMRALKAE